MIDWPDLAFNSLWILGLAIILAAVSYHDWLAYRTGMRFRELLASPTWRGPFFGGTLLVCLGLALTGRVWWEKLLWAGLALAFAWEGIELWRTE